MIAKIIVWDETRARAIQKMLKVLSDTVIFGVKTNIPLLKDILLHPEFVSGRMSTRFFEKFFPNSLTQAPPSAVKEFAIQFCQSNSKAQVVSSVRSTPSNPFSYHWKT
jgi:3-methylcrotonyl-CoA carboxylase alpha subunit